MPLNLKKPIVVVILLGLLSSPVVHALSIGETSLKSYLMQPLNAEIRLQGTEGMNAADLRVQVGDTAEFEKLGIDFDAFAAKLKLAVEARDAGWIIRVTTTDPIQQPYLQFPIRLRAGPIRLVKEITLLLDPPRGVLKPAQSGAPTASGTASATGFGEQPASERRTYRVRAGDTLWPIADRLRSQEVTRYQMMIALQRANAEAFDNGDINRLRAGSLLAVPSTEEALQIGRREASNEFWRQQRPRRSAATSPPQAVAAAPSAAASATGSEAAPVVAAPSSSESDYQDAAPALLEVLPPPEQEMAEEPLQTDPEAVQREILRSEEETRSRELEQSNIRQQIANLQAQMDQMQALLALKDQQIATLQSIIETRALARQLDSEDEAIQLSEAPATAIAPSARTAEEQPLQRPLAVETEAPLTSAATQAESEELSGLWNWLWLILVAIVILLLVLLLKRRSGSEEMHGELPLAAYPESRDKTPPPAEERNPATEPPAPAPVEKPAPSADAGLAAAPTALAAATTLTETPLEPEQVQVTEPPPAAEPEIPEEEEVDLDLGLDDFKDLPELDDILVPGEETSDDDLAEEEEKLDPIAAFWDELDANELGEIDTQPEQSEEDQSLEILLEMSRAYVELGDREEAVAILQQALSAAEDDEKRARIQAALDDI